MHRRRWRAVRGLVVAVSAVFAASSCGASNRGPSAQPTTTIAVSSTTTSTTLADAGRTASLPVFDGLVPAGAYPVLTIPLGQRVPDDLPPGTYRLRLDGQEMWPEECLAELVVLDQTVAARTPMEIRSASPVDLAQLDVSDDPRRKAYEESCGAYAVADPIDPQLVDQTIDTGPPMPTTTTTTTLPG